MLVACISDIHDRVANLEIVIDDIKTHQADLVICCGDIGSGQTLASLARSFPKEIHLVAGNVDSEEEIKGTIDRERLLAVYYHRLQGRLTIDKRRVAFTHKPKDAENLLNEGFDAVFYGHTHEAKIAEHHQTKLVNPGDIQGRFGRKPSYALYDTDTGEVSLHTVT